MIPFVHSAVAADRIHEAREYADRRRLLRAARNPAMTAFSSGVIDAVGHRLIALGARLVSDPDQHRHAA